MKNFLDRFLEIGFKQSKPELWTGAGWGREYIYSPNYFTDRHYTLVTFTYGEEAGIRDNTEYRLYLHADFDGRFIDAKFQSSYDRSKKYLDDKFDEIFKLELRNIKLNRLLNE